MRKLLQEKVIERLREIYDPEIPVDIYELGLIYEVNVAEDANVEIIMTLTTPHCPVAESMPGDVQIRAQDVEGVRDVHVELVWDPPWTIYMMSEAARLEMGFM
ncbi:MAG: SUF system Fe-S cluster assembly protein [Alphaproteobacteria bacterium]|nr:MAG: SUF system Fe-S cluster assembly protein [Alphaproteobacteria bacterium]